jgi:hypothetical protein
MKDMGTELGQYKKIVAELTFENHAMKYFIEKSCKACQIVQQPRSACQYNLKPRDD